MTPAPMALLVSAAAYLGFQWTIRLVVYPQFAAVPAQAFAAYEQRHQRLLAWTVGPLFIALGVSGVLTALTHGVPMWGRWVPLLLIALLLGVTAFGAVPLHRRLTDGFDPAIHRRLLAVDSVRLALAAALTVVAVLLV